MDVMNGFAKITNAGGPQRSGAGTEEESERFSDDSVIRVAQLVEIRELVAQLVEIRRFEGFNRSKNDEEPHLCNTGAESGKY